MKDFGGGGYRFFGMIPANEEIEGREQKGKGSRAGKGTGTPPPLPKMSH